MEDVRSGKINCIIVKDLSRFARDFREAGHYLEQIFPFLGVRFISINDHYDSSDPKPDKEGIAIPATNLINELYARDISQKVNSGLKTLRSAGKFVGALAPYGYNKSPQDKHQLVVDPPAAEVIRNIFQWLLDGWSDCQIVYHLNQQGIPSPGQYRYEQGLLKHERYENCGPWNRTAIKRLVRNRVYAGDMVQGKRSSSYFSRPGPRPESDWDIVEDTHEAIVRCTPGAASRETFMLRKKILRTGRTCLLKGGEKKRDGLPTKTSWGGCGVGGGVAVAWRDCLFFTPQKTRRTPCLLLYLPDLYQAIQKSVCQKYGFGERAAGGGPFYDPGSDPHCRRLEKDSNGGVGYGGNQRPNRGYGCRDPDPSTKSSPAAAP